MAKTKPGNFALCILPCKRGGSQKLRKERYLNKAPLLTFVHLSKCNIKLPGILGNSKILWSGLVSIQYLFCFWTYSTILCCPTFCFPLNASHDGTRMVSLQPKQALHYKNRCSAQLWISTDFVEHIVHINHHKNKHFERLEIWEVHILKCHEVCSVFRNSFNVLVFARRSQQTFSRSRYDCFIDKSLLALLWLLMMIAMMMMRC